MALKQARNYSASVAACPIDILPKPILAFTISDQVTAQTTMVRSVTVGVEETDDIMYRLLVDWELLERLNDVVGARGLRRLRVSGPAPDPARVAASVEQAQELVQHEIVKLDLPFKMPVVTPLAVLWPVAARADGPGQTDSEDQ
jgi:hypothetical protein